MADVRSVPDMSCLKRLLSIYGQGSQLSGDLQQTVTCTGGAGLPELALAQLPSPHSYNKT